MRWGAGARAAIALAALLGCLATPAAAPAREIARGAAVTWRWVEREPAYRNALLAHFRSITPENELKMAYIQPGPGVFDFTVADRMVAFARANDRRLRGHTLVWGQQIPGWLASWTWSREALLSVLERHIKTTVRHYRGRVREWDVVNEAFDADGTYRDNVWLQVIGPDYVEHAFRWAREADPHATLVYNEIGADTVNAKAASVLRMAKDFRSRGVPLDAIGLQLHVSAADGPSQKAIVAAMRRYESIGLKVRVTEMDVRTRSTRGPLARRLDAQSRTFAAAAGACAEVVACESFTTWGVGDRHSWIGSAERPLLLDRDYRPKPAYGAVRARLRGG